MAHGSIAIDAPRAEPRVRAEKRVLVVGDERVRNLAESAYCRPGWAMAACHSGGGLIPPGEWKAVVVDANGLDWLGTDHPEGSKQARRIWVVSAEAAEWGGASSPFANPLPIAGRLVKRPRDVILASTALVAVLPVLLVAMALVRFESHAPALFRRVQTRLGRLSAALGSVRTSQRVP